MSSIPPRTRIAFCALCALVACAAASAQTQVKPGFNLFSVEQDQEMGRASAQQVERQLPLIHDRTVENYVNAVGKRLAQYAPGAKYPYQFKVVNASDINAFALPGGYLYVNRGLIEAVRTEGELAGVLSHEIAHVALRHGSNQASKAYLGQAGLGILGGLVGKDSATTQKRLAAVGGFGLNALFLKFSRTDEEQADVVGSQIMAKAGYDPVEMVNFFKLLSEQSARQPSKVEQFFSSHPGPANRASRIDRERSMLTVNTTRAVGGLRQAKSKLGTMAPAPTMEQLTRDAETAQARSSSRAGMLPAPNTSSRSVARLDVAPPSTRMRSFEQRSGLYQISYPENWRVYPASEGYGVTIAPEGGMVDTGGPEPDLVYGVIVNHYDPFGEGADDRFGEQRVGKSYDPKSLVDASNDLIRQIRSSNSNLSVVHDSERRDTIDGSPAFSVVLSGRSPVTGQDERVTVFTRELPDNHVLYALFIAPGAEYVDLRETYNRMIGSLRVDDSVTHRASTSHGTTTTRPESSDSSPRQDDGYSTSGRTLAPAGTLVPITFDQTLTTAETQAGDTFTARVSEPVSIAGSIAIPSGSVVTGRVLEVVPARRIGGRAQLSLQFDSIRLPSGRSGPVSATFQRETAGETRKDTTAIGGGAAAGAVLGRIFGKDTKGAVIGAIIGGAIGTGIAATTEGEELVIPAGTVVDIQLNSPFRTTS